MSEPRVTQEWAVRYADGEVVGQGTRHLAERTVAYAARLTAKYGKYGRSEHEGAHVVVRTVTTTFTEWGTPDE